MKLTKYLLAALLLPLAACGQKEDRFVGKAVPDLRFSPIKPSGDVRLSSFKGKVVLLDFWATWCGPCKQLMPSLSQMQSKYGPKGFVVLGVTTDPEYVVQRFWFENPGLSYDLFTDPKSEASSHFAVYALPTTVLIDRQGRVSYYDNKGVGPDTAKELDVRIAALVG